MPSGLAIQARNAPTTGTPPATTPMISSGVTNPAIHDCHGVAAGPVADHRTGLVARDGCDPVRDERPSRTSDHRDGADGNRGRIGRPGDEEQGSGRVDGSHRTRRERDGPESSELEEHRHHEHHERPGRDDANRQGHRSFGRRQGLRGGAGRRRRAASQAAEDGGGQQEGDSRQQRSDEDERRPRETGELPQVRGRETLRDRCRTRQDLDHVGLEDRDRRPDCQRGRCCRGTQGRQRGTSTARSPAPATTGDAPGGVSRGSGTGRAKGGAVMVGLSAESLGPWRNRSHPPEVPVPVSCSTMTPEPSPTRPRARRSRPSERSR